MWLCTQLGFFSNVRKDPHTFHIRARCREDLEHLVQGLPITGKIHSLQPQSSWEPIILDLSIRGAA